MKTMLRAAISTDVFDYLTLSAALAEYRNVRTKIGRLLAAGEIVRIKKGLYCFPEALRRAPLEPAVVANMIYGPSYVSCDYALSYYGLIPERVELVTSMTTGHPKVFQTPVGQFLYYQRHSADYSIGITMQESKSGNFLIASPEKALYDKAQTDPRFNGREIQNYLEEDLRIEPEQLQGLDAAVWKQLEGTATGRMRKLVQFFLEAKR